MIKCIIVEDEPKAIELLKNYIDRIDFISSIGEFRNPLKAFHFLQSENVDVIFLDINMPILSGIEFYKSLKHPPFVVFTTAYDKFAVEGFELEAIDYLIKPILFPRFFSSCNRIKLRLEEKNESSATETLQFNDMVFVKSGTKTFNFLWSEVLYLEKDENYVIYHKKTGQKILSRQTLTEIESTFPYYIVRIHKSYAVSLIHIKAVDSNFIDLPELKLPLGRTCKEDFKSAFEKFKSLN